MFGLKKRTWIIGGVVAALLGTTAFAARWHNHSPEERAAWATERVADRLELNDDQKAKFQEVANAYVEIRGARTDFMVMLAENLQELAKDETLTVEEVNQLRSEIIAEFEKRSDQIIPEFVAFYSTLNDDQRKQVSTRLEEMSERIERHASYRDGRHGGRWSGKWGEHHGNRPMDNTQSE